MKEVKEILTKLGVIMCYRGFECAEFSVELAVEDESRLGAVTKEIYMPTADNIGCNWKAVECNLRTVVNRAWKLNPELMRTLAGYRLEKKPTVAEFITIVANHVLRSKSDESNTKT